MKYFIIIVLCVLSCCQAIPLNGSEPIIINNIAKQIPEVTTETSHSNKSVPAEEGSNQLQFPPGPIVSSSVNPTSTEPTTSSKTTTSVIPTTSKKPDTSTAPTTPTNAPTTTNSPLTPSTPGTITTSSVPPTSRPSTHPIVPSTPAVPTNRGFDGPSFIGGIVLAAGLMAIGFVAFKFYKARTELNYHTL